MGDKQGWRAWGPGLAAGALAAWTLAATSAPAAGEPGPAVVIVTIDGVRWQEIFRGADPSLVANPKYVADDLKENATKSWVDVPDRPGALTPFLHGAARQGGVLIGNRDAGECAHVTNDMWFSYPGYNEILTGRADNTITANEFGPNHNVTVLEWLNRQPAFHDKVSVVGNWDVFADIVNSRRSGVPVNAAMGKAWPTEVLTARFAVEGLSHGATRAMFIGFGDTDDYAHLGDYYQYLSALNRADDWIRQIWDAIQANPDLRGRTTMIVTADHGRGDTPPDAWREHASQTYLDKIAPDYLPEYRKTGITGSNNVWMLAIGPAVRPAGANAYHGGACAGSNQIAASLLTALGVDWRAFDAGAGAPLAFIGETPAQ
jgi:hypothetical protein